MHIHPNALTVPKIIERLRDTDSTVRSVAYRKCALIGPQYFRLPQRHEVLLSGFSETNSFVVDCFTGTLLPKWLVACDGDILTFLSVLKLDASEEDVKLTDLVWEKVLKQLFRYV